MKVAQIAMLLLAAAALASARVLEDPAAEAFLEQGRRNGLGNAWGRDTPAQWDGVRFNFRKFPGGARAALGRTKLAEIAAKMADATPEQVVELLDNEPSFGIDMEAGMPIYACEGIALPEGEQAPEVAHADHSDHSHDLSVLESLGGVVSRAAEPAQIVGGSEVASGMMPTVVDPTLTQAQAFGLSSRPSAVRKIFLDFRGGELAGLQWQKSYGVGATSMVIPPFNKGTDSPSTWSAAELSDIVAIWRAVAEDFALFDVDVTTKPMAQSDTVLRALIGGDGTAACKNSTASWTCVICSGCGGVAYTNVAYGPYYGPQYGPALVFPKKLGPDSPKQIAEATSHELGHNFGLRHDGRNTTATGFQSYYSGAGDWAPIMGLGYSKPLSQWSKGEYTGATETQDDLAIIAAKAPYITSEIGTTRATATVLTATTATDGSATASAVGVVMPGGAQKWFAIDIAAGTLSLSLGVVSNYPGTTLTRSNLDAVVKLHNPAGSLLQTFAPANGAPFSAANLGVPLTTTATLAAGRYFVSVEGTGVGDPKTTGYSSYATGGQFEFRATFRQGAQQSPGPSPPPTSPPPTSPPPTTAQWGMKVSTMTISRTCSSSRRTCTCAVTPTVVYTSGPSINKVVPSAAVTIEWSSKRATTGFPYRTTSTTATTGKVTFTSNTMSNAAGGGCTATVRGIAKPATATVQYAWDNVAFARSSFW